MRQRDMFARQLAKAIQVLAILMKVPLDKELKKVELSAIIITDKAVCCCVSMKN